jgi:hypothetical protein
MLSHWKYGETSTNRETKDIGFNVQEIPFRWIWLKICILMDFEVMNYVSLTLKALTPLLDPVLGQNVELGFCK